MVLAAVDNNVVNQIRAAGLRLIAGAGVDAELVCVCLCRTNQSVSNQHLGFVKHDDGKNEGHTTPPAKVNKTANASNATITTPPSADTNPAASPTSEITSKYIPTKTW